MSKEFFELVKSIGESRSKQEEDKIIVTEIAILKNNLSAPKITSKKMKEYMIRAVYIEMLGHDASFAYIHAVKLTNEKHLFAKRIGYLTCNLFLHKDHELMLLLINTMQRDLQSANHLEVCAALTSVCRLVNMDMIPAIQPLVLKLLSHPQEIVRKKAILSMHRFFKLVPEQVADQKDVIRKVLCDPDPSVMGASLHVLFEVAKANPAGSKDLVPSFVSILKQITEHRLPRDFDYHRMPAPWLQVKLLSILGVIGTADQKASEQMYDILRECMRRADSGVNVGYAIIYECVKCITRIYPGHSLLELASSSISRFISSDNHNLKYLGVTGLAQIVQVNASYATEHQMVVVDCLEDPDETLKRKTLDLLYRMTSPQNVEVVAEKLTSNLRTSVDLHLRRELVERITSLAERFAPNNEWYVNTMNTVFELGGEIVPAETAYNLMRLVAEGTGEDDAADQAFRTFAVNTYLKLLERPVLSDILVQVIAWVLGEYAKLATVDGYSLEDIVDLLCECVDRPFEDLATRGYLVNALMKLVGQNNLASSSVSTVIRNYRCSRLTDLQQRCYEFDQLLKAPALMRKALPYDASCEEFIINKDLTFLNDFVDYKLEQGSKPYQDVSQRETAKSLSQNGGKPGAEAKPTLNFTPYTAPSKPVGGGGYPSVAADSAADDASSKAEAPTGMGLNVSGPRKWGPAGYVGNSAKEERPKEPERPVPAASTTSVFDSSASTAPKTGTFGSKPAEPAAMTEKQKMAAALFGGLGGSAAPAATASPAKPLPSVSAGVAFDPKPSPSQPAPPKPAETPVPAPAPATGVDLLLDFDDAGSSQPSAPAAATSSAPVPSAGTGEDLLLLDMGDALGTPAPPPPAALAAPAPEGLLDLEGMGTATAAPAAPTMPAAPMLAPYPVNIQQVGQMWGQLPTERSMHIQTSVTTCQELMTRLQVSMNVHPVEIIGMEGIAAGRVVPGTDPCFLHGKLAVPRVELLVRTRDPGVAAKVAENCAKALA